VTSKWIVCFVLMLVLAVGDRPSWAQNQRLPSQLPESQPTAPEDEARSKMERDMAKKANQERQAALKKDTDKLLKLASELKEYVDKSNENMLSMDVVKKAEEIEKLAHSVKDKMKGN
jgi:predicted  nucleic acid-binding Zn-ribbon protein